MYTKPYEKLQANQLYLRSATIQKVIQLTVIVHPSGGTNLIQNQKFIFRTKHAIKETLNSSYGNKLRNDQAIRGQKYKRS